MRRAWLSLLFCVIPALCVAGEQSRTPFKVPKGSSKYAAVAPARNLPSVLPLKDLSIHPFSMVGKLTFKSGVGGYSGSATLVGPKLALTAAHNVWDPIAGWSTNMRFDRAKYGGTRGRAVPAKQIYIYSSKYMAAADRNPSSGKSFAWDSGWITFYRKPARGGFARVAVARNVLKSKSEMRAIGYGSDFHGGAYPLTVTPTVGFHRVFGSYYENFTYGTEGGMSGGPVFARVRGQWTVIAVVVSGYYDYSGSGVRAVDRRLIRAMKSAAR